MGKKKEPSIQDAVAVFKSVIQRASLSDYTYLNRTILSKTKDNKSVLIVPDLILWQTLNTDEEFTASLREFNLGSKEDRNIFDYGNNLESGVWFEIDAEEISKGKIVHVQIQDFDYEVPISRVLLPLKLKKAEFNNLFYRVDTKPYMLILKKYFQFPIDGCGFYLVRAYQIL